MTDQTQVSPDAETLNPAPELTNQTPEVVTPETTEQAPEQTSEKDERDRTIARMERRLNKKHAEAAMATERARLLEERLTQFERQPAEGQERQPANHDEAIRATARTLAQEMTQQQKVADTIGSVLKAGKALPEFDRACNTVAEELPFYEPTGKPTPFLAAVLEFDNPAQLLHHIGTNPDLAAELADLSQTRRVLRLGAIERELTDAAKPRASTAPKPLEPVRGQGAGSKDPSAMTDAEFTAWRKAQIAAKRR